VHLLLPPSEGKTTGGRGRALRGRIPGTGELTAARARAIDALRELVAGDRRAAAAALLLPAGVADDALRANAAVFDSPTTPALRRYAGVVYDGLDFSSLDAREQRVAGRSCLIFSGLFGVVRGDEPVPAYRVPAKAILPGLGVAGTFWRPVLDNTLPSIVGRHLVVDLRSSDYAAMWRPGRHLTDQVVSVRVLSPAPRGGHAVISYNSKFAKGRLAAELVRRAAAGDKIASAGDVAEAWLKCDGAADARMVNGRLDLYTS
jgi:cytoplasmic iron level regulating protein YaaA (DUF328/UPF0246 family)